MLSVYSYLSHGAAVCYVGILGVKTTERLWIDALA